MKILLSREQFRDSVFERDKHKCVVCGQEAKDAHHIIERRLFVDGGYYVDNGCSLCEVHHLTAETTTLSCDELRKICKINEVVLPEHLYQDGQYDKWGNPILENGRRLKGELFYDESIQKILTKGGVLSLFDDRVKYPRTHHIPFSPGITKDDRVQHDLSMFVGHPIVITEKMDGENTTMYRDAIHARSVEYNPHLTRNWVKKLHSQIAHDIPPGWRVCGENLYAKHSIKYTELESYFQVFSVWNEHNLCLNWDETVEWAKLLGLVTVPVIGYATYYIELERNITGMVDEYSKAVNREIEGYTVRIADDFSYREFPRAIVKWVRKNHVQTHGGWMRSLIEVNDLRKVG